MLQFNMSWLKGHLQYFGLHTGTLEDEITKQPLLKTFIDGKRVNGKKFNFSMSWANSHVAIELVMQEPSNAKEQKRDQQYFKEHGLLRLKRQVRFDGSYSWHMLIRVYHKKDEQSLIPGNMSLWKDYETSVIWHENIYHDIADAIRASASAKDQSLTLYGEKGRTRRLTF